MIEDETGVPTAQVHLLETLIGRRLDRFVRYSWDPAALAAKAVGDVAMTFERTSGPAVLHFAGGPALGAFSDPALASVLVWDEGAADSPISSDDELFPVDAGDPTYARAAVGALLGATVVGVRVLRNADRDAYTREVPAEVGVEISFDTGARLLLHHGMHDGTDQFAVTVGPRLTALRVETCASIPDGAPS